MRPAFADKPLIRRNLPLFAGGLPHERLFLVTHATREEGLGSEGQIPMMGSAPNFRRRSRRSRDAAARCAELLESRIVFAAPTAALTPPASVTDSALFIDFTITYTDDGGVDPATLGFGLDPFNPTSPHDLTVAGPNGFSAQAFYVPADGDDNAVRYPRVATYRLVAPGGRFDAADNGVYTIAMNGTAVQDTEGLSVAAGSLGNFTVNVPAANGGTFDGTNGTSSDFAVKGMVTQSDGKIVAAGSERYARAGIESLGESPGEVVVVRRDVLRRFNADGSVDTTFGGGDGRVEIGGDGADTAAYSLLVLPDGKLLVASGRGFPASDFVISRYSATGAIDTTFGAGGSGSVVIDFDANFTGHDVPLAMARQSDGKIVIAGRAETDRGGGNFDTDFALARINADGSLDAGFGSGGLVRTDMSSGGDDAAGSIFIGTDGKIVIAGVANAKPAVAKYNANGTPDNSFDGDGQRVFSTWSVAHADDFAVGLAERQTAGSTSGLLLAASTGNGADFSITLLDYATGATQTSGFGTNGIVTANFGGDAEDADAIVALPSGSFLVAGTSKSGPSLRTAVAAFHADGTPDLAYGAGGEVLFDAIDVTGTIGSSSPLALHVDEVALRATAVLGADGNAVIARNNEPGASTLRRVAADTTAPTVSLSPATGVTVAGTTSNTLTVVYADNGAIDVSTITAAGGGAITVNGPAGAMVVNLVNIVPNADGTPITVTYSVIAPPGGWQASHNGTYTVSLTAGTIGDTTGNNFAAGGAFGSFTVNIVPGSPGVSLTPVAPLTASGGSTQTFAVVYTDSDGIDTATIDVSDVLVTRNGSPLPVTAVNISGSGATVTATYTVQAPGGVWDSSDNGEYQIALVADAVRDLGGTAAPQHVLGGFTVAISTPGNDGTPLGEFGLVDGRKQKLVVEDADGTLVTLDLKGGTGMAFFKDGRINLVLNGTTAASTLTIKGKGGDGRVEIGDIRSDGALRSINAATSDVSGTGDFAGAVASLKLGVVTGRIGIAGSVLTAQLARLDGTLVVSGDLRTAKMNALAGNLLAGGTMNSVTIGADGTTNARILSGATLGADLAFGGTGDDADTYAAGFINKLTVKGIAANTLIAAGLDPINGLFVDGDDQVIGNTSLIRTLKVGAVDANTRFVAAGFVSARIPFKADPATDEHFLDL